MFIPVSRYVKVKQYPYRTARMRNIAVVISRDANEILVEELAERANARKDNHVLYTLERDGEVICIQVTDEQIQIGTGLIEEP